jgi:hypothetical protein
MAARSSHAINKIRSQQKNYNEVRHRSPIQRRRRLRSNSLPPSPRVLRQAACDADCRAQNRHTKMNTKEKLTNDRPNEAISALLDGSQRASLNSEPVSAS